MGLMYLLINALAVALFINLVPIEVQGKAQLFQLASVESNLCLQIKQDKGALVPCKTKHGDPEENTIFLVNTDLHENNKVHIFGTGKCLDKVQHDSSTSNLCYSECDQSGVIKWNISIINGSVSEGSNKNCIYIDSNGDAFVHQCSNGFAKFEALPLAYVLS